jgi:hypothetical protein
LRQRPVFLVPIFETLLQDRDTVFGAVPFPSEDEAWLETKVGRWRVLRMALKAL